MGAMHEGMAMRGMPCPKAVECPDQKVCRVPVFISFDEKERKIKVEPETAYLYWGMGVVFEVVAKDDEKVEIEFERIDPFRPGAKKGSYVTFGSDKIKTGPSLRLPDLPARDPKKIGIQKPATRLKYSVRWSSGKRELAVLDPTLIFVDNGY